MSRKRNHAGPGHERWLVSYADFITLLFAFFVVMFASSQADRNKARMASEAFQQAFDGPGHGAGNSPKSGPGKAESPGSMKNLEFAMGLLSKQLDPEIRAGKMRVRMSQRGLIVSLSQATFFPSGEEAVDPSTFDILQKVASVIRVLPNPIRAEGHTDSIPIHTARFHSNWELAAARAIAVMELLRDRWGIPAERLAVTGYADTVPIDSNQTEAGRARNRRVDIVVLTHETAERESPKRPD